MPKLFTINNKDIPEVNTMILYTSDFNYTLDAQEYILNNCIVLTKDTLENITLSPHILKDFNCEYLINKQDLTLIDKIKINIINSLTNSNKVYVFFNVLTYLDNEFKTNIIAYLKEHHKQIINYTTDIEETLLLDYLIVLQNNNIIMEGPKEEILKEEKNLKKLGFNLPFIVELSIGLKYYNLIDKIYFTNESLVAELWK